MFALKGRDALAGHRARTLTSGELDASVVPHCRSSQREAQEEGDQARKGLATLVSE